MKNVKSWKNGVYSFEKELKKHKFKMKNFNNEERKFINNNTFIGTFSNFKNNFKTFDSNLKFNTLEELENYKNSIGLNENNNLIDLIEYNKQDLDFSMKIAKNITIFEKKWRARLLEYVLYVMERERFKINIHKEKYFHKVFSSEEYIKLKEMKNWKNKVHENWLLWLKFRCRFLIYEEMEWVENKEKTEIELVKNNHLLNQSQKPGTPEEWRNELQKENLRLKQEIQLLNSKKKDSRTIENIKSILNMYPQYKKQSIKLAVEKLSFNELKKITTLLIDSKTPNINIFILKMLKIKYIKNNSYISIVSYYLKLITRLRNTLSHAQSFSSFLNEEKYFLEMETKRIYSNTNFTFSINENVKGSISSFYKTKVIINQNKENGENDLFFNKTNHLENIILKIIKKIIN